jgi:hypothetical protein
MRRRLGAVRGAERIIGVDVAERRHLPRERFVVFLFAFVDPAVLQQDQLARLHGDTIDPSLLERHGPSKQLAKALGDRRE